MLLNRKRRGGALDSKALADALIQRGDAARDERRWRDAGALYREALALFPDRAGVRIQAGHMFKEAGEHAEAETHYLAALAQRPDDADLALQLGHFYKASGRPGPAQAQYRRALTLAPGMAAARNELRNIEASGWRESAPADAPEPGIAPIPELVRRPRHDKLVHHSEGVELRRIGRRERTQWGIRQALRGLEALRGYAISREPIVELQLLLDGQLFHRGPVRGGYPLTYERDDPDLRKYVFNAWYDFSGYAPGSYEMEFRLIRARGPALSRHERIAIATPLREEDHPTSDGIITLADGTRTPDEQVRARSSVTRPGRRAMLPRLPRTILVQRADQLGDVVVSVPALKRLRALAPDARIVGLLSTANRDLAATLGLFDEIVTVDFPDDPWERRRVLDADRQEQLRRQLAPYSFDMAIDFSENGSSRPLLTLSGAPILVGFRSDLVPSLTVEIEGNTHDRWDGHEIVPHTNKLLGLIEWLGAMMRSEPNILRREDLSRDRLAHFGVAPKERFIVLHDGARLQFSRWSHYPRLAELILAQTDCRVILLSDDPTLRERLSPALTGSDAFRLVDQRLAFDDLDALLSFATVFVGNDSGPKHVASLRGTPVVSIHMARNNWNEWGQENGGFVISRRVPCAGCLVWHDPEECGRDFVCITDIAPDEVLRAIAKLL